MKKRILTFGFAISAIFTIIGCGGGNLSNTNGGAIIGNNALVPYSPTVANQREVIYKTDTTPSATSLFSNGVLATVPANYSKEIINSIELDNNYLFVTNNKTRTTGCNFSGCPQTQFLYLVDKNTGAATMTNFTANLNLFGYSLIYQISKQNSRYVFSNAISNTLDYRLDKIDTHTGITSQITLNGTDVVLAPLNGKSIAEDSDNIYFTSIDSTSHSVFNTYKIETNNNDNIVDYPGLVNYHTVNLFVINNKLIMFALANNNASPVIAEGLYIADKTNPSASPTAISNSVSGVVDFATKIDNKIYFETQDTVNLNYYLYVLDPSQPINNALTKLETINRSADGKVENIFKYNGNIYFVQKNKLHKTDGSTPNSATVVLSNLANSTSGDNKIYQADGKLYYRGSQTATGKELWVYDGTTSTRLTDINPGNGDSNPKNILELNGKIVFQATPDGTNNKLYSLDGTTLTPLN